MLSQLQQLTCVQYQLDASWQASRCAHLQRVKSENRTTGEKPKAYFEAAHNTCLQHNQTALPQSEQYTYRDTRTREGMYVCMGEGREE